MKAIFFSFLLLGSIFFNVNAQPPGLKAKIVDEKGQALVGAHIVLKSLETGKENAILSNGSGEFVFQRVAPGLYSLRISYVGHENYSENISILSFPKNMGEIILKEEAKEIGEVSIVKKVPLATINEDTIEYNADAYKTTPDADAEDLVAKMPGVEISEGSVKAQGEEIEKVKVDGKPFFNNDPSLALKNLPAEIIEKIQIYEEQSEQSQFTGFDDGNTTKTMNVVTRKNMRKGQFGKFYAGYGPENYYALGGNLSDFNGDRRITILGQSNNLSNQGFSMQDILGAMGSRGSRGGGRAGGQGGMRGGSGGSPNMQNFMIGQQSGVSEISTLGINYNDSWGEKTTVSGNYFFNKVDNLTEEMTNQQYRP